MARTRKLANNHSSALHRRDKARTASGRLRKGRSSEWQWPLYARHKQADHLGAAVRCSTDGPCAGPGGQRPCRLHSSHACARLQEGGRRLESAAGTCLLLQPLLLWLLLSVGGSDTATWLLCCRSRLDGRGLCGSPLSATANAWKARGLQIV